jgi:PKD repeat protein
MMVQPGVLSERASPRLSSRSRARTRLNHPAFLILLLSLAAGRLTAQVVAGPVINPSNGHAYWLLAEDSWTHSEAQAVALGGHLATINDQAEQDWIVAEFGQDGGVYRELWIGFRSTTNPVPASAFRWVSGQPTTYTHWAPPEPNDPEEPPAPSLYVRVYSLEHSQYPGFWDNWPDSWQVAGYPSGTNPSGVVETTVVEPVARFTLSPSSPTVNQPVSFADTSTGAPSSWLWNFGDQGSSTAQNPEHVYSTAGSYTVRLTVGNAYGMDTTTRVVTVAQNQPVAQFTLSPSSPSINQPVSFIDTSTGSPSSWLWSFGDQSSSTTQNPVHVYTAAGTFNVTLSVSNAYGADSTTRTVTVGEDQDGCIAGGTTLCLNEGRFQVTALWRTADGSTGPANAEPLTADTGYFWFFSPSNVEVVAKVLDACGTTFNAYWVFAAGLTNVEVTLTVTDSATQEVRTYTNPLGVAFQPIQDTSAFLTCP